MFFIHPKRNIKRIFPDEFQNRLTLPVIAGLVPAIQGGRLMRLRPWIPGTRPGMTNGASFWFLVLIIHQSVIPDFGENWIDDAKI
jgi:hypothetical protein